MQVSRRHPFITISGHCYKHLELSETPCFCQELISDYLACGYSLYCPVCPSQCNVNTEEEGEPRRTLVPISNGEVKSLTRFQFHALVQDTSGNHPLPPKKEKLQVKFLIVTCCVLRRLRFQYRDYKPSFGRTIN
jgi:hypothetical protein